MQVRTNVCAVLIALPWLWPFTWGPQAASLPYLTAAALGALTLLAWPGRAHVAESAAKGWALAASLSAVIALLQYFNLEDPLYPWVNLAATGQAYGNLRQPNQLASLLAIGLYALIWLVPRTGVLVRAALWLTAAVVSAGLAVTASRVGLVHLVLLALAMLIWRGGPGWGVAPESQGEQALPARARRSVAVLAAAVLGYAVGALLLPDLLAQHYVVANERDIVGRIAAGERTCGSRLILYSNVIDLIRQSPWTGWGWNELAWAHFMNLYPGARFCHILDNAHNLPLHLAVTLGLPVAALACALVLWGVWRGRPWRQRDAGRQLAWGVVAVIATHSMVEYPLWYGPFQIALVLALVLMRRPATGLDWLEASATPRAAGWLPPALATVALACVAYAGWDYWRVGQLYMAPAERAAPFAEDTLTKARHSWLYAGAVDFAELTSTVVQRENAEAMLELAQKTLHFSPEPRVAEKLIEAAVMQGQYDLATVHLLRLKRAFPDAYERFTKANAAVLAAAVRQRAAASTPVLDGR